MAVNGISGSNGFGNKLFGGVKDVKGKKTAKADAAKKVGSSEDKLSAKAQVFSGIYIQLSDIVIFRIKFTTST